MSAASRRPSLMRLAALYLEPYASTDGPAHKSVRESVSFLAEIASAFRGAGAPIR